MIQMRECIRAIVGFCLTLSPFVLAACSSSPEQQTTATTTQPAKTAVKFDDKPLHTPTATLIVHGMGCPQCSSNVDKQLLAIQGVQQVSVNLGTGEVVVRIAPDQPPTGKQLAAAIKKSGYTLIRIDEGGELPLDTAIFPKTVTGKGNPRHTSP